MSRKNAIKYYKIGRSLPQGSEESQHYFNLSIQADDTFSYSYFEKSVPFNKRGDYEKGFDLLNKAVVLNPRMHLGYRGWLRLVKLKDYLGCIKDLDKLIKIKSKNVYNAWGENINYLLGICWLELGDSEKALFYFNMAIGESVKVNLKHYLFKSMALASNNKYEESIKDLEFCIERNINFTEAYYYLGINYESINNIREAKQFYNKAYSLLLRGIKIKNPYNEVFKELYLNDISISIKN